MAAAGPDQQDEKLLPTAGLESTIHAGSSVVVLQAGAVALARGLSDTVVR